MIRAPRSRMMIHFILSQKRDNETRTQQQYSDNGDSLHTTMDFFVTTIKERVGRFGARAKYRCQDVVAKLKRHSTTDLKNEQHLQILDPNWAQLRDSDNAEENIQYYKLAYAVKKRFFDHLLVPPKAYATGWNPHYHQCSIALHHPPPLWAWTALSRLIVQCL